MTSVKLVSFTPDPIPLLFCTEKFAKTNTKEPLLIDVQTVAYLRRMGRVPGQWVGSREKRDLEPYIQRIPEVFPELAGATNVLTAYADMVDAWALKVASMAIPVSEMVNFVFQLEGVTIALREQLVRHRVGTSFWIQSGRITDYSKVWDDEKFNIPPAISKAGLGEEWQNHWLTVQDLYRRLKASGIQDEDAREIIGSGATHRLTLGINMRALMELLKHRVCWIAQEPWVPVVMGIVRELRDKVDPVFEVLGHPPCWNHKKEFTGCKYDAICLERYEGKDPLPVCPLWRGHIDSKDGAKSVEELRSLGRWNDDRCKKYGTLWNHK
jgi:hypothetical protein